MCITDSLCCTAETNTTLQINYTPIKINLKNALSSLHCLQDYQYIGTKEVIQRVAPMGLESQVTIK